VRVCRNLVSHPRSGDRDDPPGTCGYCALAIPPGAWRRAQRGVPSTEWARYTTGMRSTRVVTVDLTVLLVFDRCAPRVRSRRGMPWSITLGRLEAVSGKEVANCYLASEVSPNR
jgi:hypothetical protein